MNKIMMTYIKVLTLVVFFNLTNFNFGFDGRQLVHELGSKLCPYTNFCTLKASELNLDMSLTPCCRPCFCDDGCWELDNCCPDKEGTTQASSGIIPCKNSKVKSVRLRKRETRTFGSGYFRVIGTCPSTEENVTLIELCTKEMPNGLEDYIWVSDYRNGKIYQNVYCAKCHRIDSYVSWQIRTTCVDILHADFVNVEEMLLLSDSCDIINVVPDGLKVMAVKYECFDNMLHINNICSESPHGQLGNHSHDIVAACELSTWAYKHWYGNFADKNVFCYVCMRGLDAELVDLCDHLYNPKADPQDSFSVIINYHDKPLKDETNEDSGCHRNEVLDKYLGRCHKLICPLGRAPMLGHCEPILSNIGSLCIGIHFYLEILWPRNNLETLYNESTIGEHVHWQFLQYVGWDNANCGISYSYVKVANKTTPPAGFLVWYDIGTTSSCQPDFVQQQASDILGRLITVDITEAVLVILVHPVKWHADDSTQMRRIYFHYGMLGTPSCRFYVTPNAEMFCPKIELNLSHVEMFSAMQENEKRMFLSFFEKDNVQNDTDTIYICAEEYFSLMSLANACLCLRVTPTIIFEGLTLYILF